jgi:CBS domain-containing protein
MHKDTATVPANESLREALHLLVVAGIGGLPVVGPDGAVVGILSSADVLGAIDQACDEDRDEDEPDDLRESLQAITAGEIATPEVIWVSPETYVSEVSEIMCAEGIHRVLVGTSGKLEGVLTSFDLLRAV